jgi:hypothetical protein
MVVLQCVARALQFQLIDAFGVTYGQVMMLSPDAPVKT